MLLLMNGASPCADQVHIKSSLQKNVRKLLWYIFLSCPMRKLSLKLLILYISDTKMAAIMLEESGV